MGLRPGADVCVTVRSHVPPTILYFFLNNLERFDEIICSLVKKHKECPRFKIVFVILSNVPPIKNVSTSATDYYEIALVDLRIIYSIIFTLVSWSLSTFHHFIFYSNIIYWHCQDYYFYYFLHVRVETYL